MRPRALVPWLILAVALAGLLAAWAWLKPSGPRPKPAAVIRLEHRSPPAAPAVPRDRSE